VSFILFYLVFPVIVVFPVSVHPFDYLHFPPRGFSLRWYQSFFTDRIWISSTILSFQVAALTTIAATAIGTASAIGLMRGNVRGKGILQAVLLSPLVVPAIIIGLSSFFLLTALGIKGTALGFVLVYTVLALPFVVLVVAAGLQGVDEELERAAMNLGASRLRAFVVITVPLIRPAILTAALFAFRAAFDEAVITIFISGYRIATLPKTMFDAMFDVTDLTVAAASSLMTLLTTLLLISTQLIRHRVERARTATAG
jgi:ABC-type spermidine/putrescine transport system permease subunit II